MALSTLHHVIDLEWMQKAYRLTRKDGAPGIDGVTADDYATNLDANLLDLLDRIKSGRDRAPPVRRAYIPKTDGSRRPLGIPTRPSAGGGDGLVSDQPASVHLGPARPSDRDDAGPLCLLRHNRQLSTIKLVRPSGREDLGEMAVTAGSRKPVLLAPVHCAPKALSSPSTSNCPSLHHCERGSPMKNRKREICTSGSVRDEDGQPPHLLGRERLDFSPIDRRPPLRFPEGIRLVVWPLIALEEWDLSRPMARMVISPPQGQPQLPDLPNWSWHEYGMRVGFWR
ncbi:MAG: hypothetical protein ACREXY_22750, partial [Gammaproteobacteria bacterium]